MTDPDFQPFLADSQISISPLVADDWAGLYAVASDPLIWTHHPATDRWQEPVFRKSFDQSLASGGAVTVRDLQSGSIIGSSRYDVTRTQPGEIEIGWTFLARSHWGGSTNAAMKRLMIDHGLRAFERVIFLIAQDNVRSRRAMEKIGGMLTDRVYDAAVADKVLRHVIYAIDREQFDTGPLNITRQA